MRSLFPRIFLSFWVAMTLIGAAFAAIYATTFSSARMERFRSFMDSALEREVERAVESSDPSRELRRFQRDTEIALFVADGDNWIGPSSLPADARALARETARDRRRHRLEVDDYEITSFAIDDRVAVARIQRPSRWARWVGIDTLPWRLLVVFAISGLVSFALARYLTRPLRSLRRATQRFADGDLGVRVGPELGRADAEIAALGREFDRMAARVEHLVGAQQQLLSDVSHELNSPLARQRVALELARKSAGPAAGPALDRIEREAERLAALIGEILTLSRLEQEAPSREVVDVEALLDAVVRDADFEARGGERSVRLERSVAASIAGDEEILRRAIENVVRNAVRFAPAGTEVTVAMEREGGEIVLAVRDRGPGVPEHALREIFVPLYRVEKDRDRKTGGAGLGLAIAERAVKLHGGSIGAENAEPGLLVTMRLPNPGA
jgi:two-component system, OmpR family, sensor kinase